MQACLAQLRAVAETPPRRKGLIVEDLSGTLPVLVNDLEPRDELVMGDALIRPA